MIFLFGWNFSIVSSDYSILPIIFLQIPIISSITTTKILNYIKTINSSFQNLFLDSFLLNFSEVVGSLSLLSRI